MSATVTHREPISQAWRLVAWALFIPLFIFNDLPTWKWMIARWDEAESYMSHGWLIPAISAFLAYRLRASLPQRSVGSAWSLLLIVLALLLHAIAGLADVSSIAGFTMIPLLFGFVWLIEGAPRARALAFPIFFLAFMVPPPEFVISGMNFRLKLVAADIACWLINLTGMPAIREGSFMLFGDGLKLAIGDVCSGLRSLLALMSLSVLYAYLIRDRGIKHIIAILLAAMPAAILGNGIRIGLVCYLVSWLGSDRVFKPIIGTYDLHLLTGSLIFIGALIVLLAVTSILDAWDNRHKKAPPNATQSKAT